MDGGQCLEAPCIRFTGGVLRSDRENQTWWVYGGFRNGLIIL